VKKVANTPPPSDVHKDDPQSKLTSPALYSHKNIPPTFLQVAGWDPLRDDGLVYDKILREEGIPTRLESYPGLPHGFWQCWPEAEFSKKHARDTLEGFRWLLSRPTESCSYT
jgi:acetyl esterase/lipase